MEAPEAEAREAVENKGLSGSWTLQSLGDDRSASFCLKSWFLFYFLALLFVYHVNKNTVSNVYR